MEILGLKTQIEQVEELPAGIGVLIRSLGFPQYQASEIKSITRELKGRGIKDVLENHSFNISFGEDFLQLVEMNWAALQPWRESVSASVLFMWVAWAISGNDPITRIVSILGLVAKGGGNEGVLAVQAIFYCISSFLNSGFQTIEPKFVDWFRALFDLDAIYPNEFFVLLANGIAVVAKDQNMDELTTQICCFVVILCEERKESFKDDVADMLIEPLMLRIANLEVPALSMFSHLSKFMSTEENMKVVLLVSNSVVKRAMSQKPFLTLPEPSKEDVIELPPLMTSEAVWRFWPDTAFVNGLNVEKAMVFPELLKLDDIVESGTQNVLSLMLRVAERNEGLAHAVFDVFVCLLLLFKVCQEG